jgi:SAM-dependent methyltransferase
MHLNSELLFTQYAKKYFSEGQRVLEIGPNGYPSYYSRLLNISGNQWHTLDIGSDHIEGGEKNPQHITSSSEYNYPIESNTYDVVISGQVMEHVKKIWVWIDELKRVTKKNGLIILIVPVSWPYHAVPVDCWRIYPEGMRALLEDKQLSILECKFESLEKTLIPGSTPTIPGDETINVKRHISKRIKWLFAYNKIVSRIPLMRKLVIPVTVAYDTICICKKD